MDFLLFAYGGDYRELKKIIVAILKSGLVDEIKKVNYVHNYSIRDKKINKSEEKLILIRTNDKDKLGDFLSKNFSQLKRINIA